MDRIDAQTSKGNPLTADLTLAKLHATKSPEGRKMVRLDAWRTDSYLVGCASVPHMVMGRTSTWRLVMGRIPPHRYDIRGEARFPTAPNIEETATGKAESFG